MKKIGAYLGAKKYETLLVSFLLLIFGDTICPCGSTDFAPNILVAQNMIIGLVLFYREKRVFYLLAIIDLFAFVLTVLSDIPSFPHFDLQSWRGILYLIYFIVVSVEVYRKIFSTRSISMEMISAVLCGFILLCLVGTFLFYQVEVLRPHSFSNVGTGKARLPELNYFSFVTLLTTGYGDIVPLTVTAKKCVMLIGLAGHFYTVFVTGIVIGKYINKTA